MNPFDLCALGLWMSTDLLISVECDDLWDLFTDEDREYFGVQTRDAFRASYENQGLCDILMRAYAFLNLDWTYVEINGALYITAVSEYQYDPDHSVSTVSGNTNDVRAVHYATIVNGALLHFGFNDMGPEPDDDAAIKSMMETVNFSYAGID